MSDTLPTAGRVVDQTLYIGLCADMAREQAA
jgi:hypothetical protein